MPKDSFINKRVRVTLHDATMIRVAENRRLHLRVSINLSEMDSLTAMPEWITSNFSLMQKARNKNKKSDLDEKLENVSIGFWSTERIRSRFFSQVMEASLSKFVMERKGEGDEAVVKLYFSIHFAGRREIHDWTYDHKAADLWMDFEQQQGTLDMEGAEEESEPEDEEESEDAGEEQEDDDANETEGDEEAQE